MKERIRQEWYQLWGSKKRMPKKGHKTYLDMVKGIAIFLVVLGHSDTIGPTVNTWLSTFHLPAFFIVSGILMSGKREEELPLKQVLPKKCKRLFVPYFGFSAITAPMILLNILEGHLDWAVMKELLWRTVSFQGYSVMWFLPVLFLAEFFVLLWLKLIVRNRSLQRFAGVILCLLTTILSLLAYKGYGKVAGLPLNAFWLGEIRVVAKAVVAGSFIGFGYLIGTVWAQAEKKWQTCQEKIWYRIGGVCLGLLLSGVNLACVSRIRLMDLNNLNVGALPVYLFLGAVGSLGILLICKNIPNIPIVAYYGQNSLIIMCTHLNLPILNTALVHGQYIARHLPGTVIPWWWLVSMAGAMLLELPVILLIHVCCPFLLGKGRREGSR